MFRGGQCLYTNASLTINDLRRRDEDTLKFKSWFFYHLTHYTQIESVVFRHTFLSWFRTNLGTNEEMYPLYRWRQIHGNKTCTRQFQLRLTKIKVFNTNLLNQHIRGKTSPCTYYNSTALLSDLFFSGIFVAKRHLAKLKYHMNRIQKWIIGN